MTSEYQVLARKWRPVTFSDMVGQEHITRTLCNAIMQDRTAHAYLFVGPRGIGKTTSARIFAKALNCTSSESGEPCCKCDSCVSIAEGRNIDIIEIDAASQNSVNNIRELREEVMYAPAKSRYKVYIIDEVHMLSAGAWNALLKTVEEPPPHAKFLFATTEVHKVLPTIISRCQRFDLRRIPVSLILERLKKIADVEEFNISESALEAIARAADGGMRDAQSLMDQMISFFDSSDSEISEEQVLSLFGLTAGAEMEQLVASILKDDKQGVVANIHMLSTKGKNLETLFGDLLSFLRGVQLCQLLDTPENVLDSGAESIDLFKRLGAGINRDLVQRLLETLSPVGTILHNALNKQVYLETLILKAMRTAHSVRIEDLLVRLNQIRKGGELEIVEDLSSLASVQVASTPPPPPVAPVKAEATAKDASSAEEHVDADRVLEELKLQEDRDIVVASDKAQQVPNDEEDNNHQDKLNEDISVSEADMEEEQASLPVADDNIEQLPLLEDVGYSEHRAGLQLTDYLLDQEEAEATEKGEQLPDSSGSKPWLSTPSTGDEQQAEDVPSSDDVSASSTTKEFSSELQHQDTPASFSDRFSSPEELWHLLMADIADHMNNPVLKQFMEEGRPEAIDGSVLRVVFDEEYEREHAEKVIEEKVLLENCLFRITGNGNAQLKVELKQGISSPAELPHHKVRKDMEAVKSEVRENDFVKSIVDMFDGSVVDIHA